jgi:hypothetical protein
MGFGLPGAIGAKVAAPHKTVVDIDGDASFSMTAMELATASQYNIGVKVLVFNNEFQGMVQQWQGSFYLFPFPYTSHPYYFQINRFVLREPLFPYSHGQPRLCPPSAGYGCACHPVSFGGRASSQDERVLGT